MEQYFLLWEIPRKSDRLQLEATDAIIKGELSRQISGLAKLKLLLDKERKKQNEHIRGGKQCLSLAEDTLRRLDLELRTVYESHVKGMTDKTIELRWKFSNRSNEGSKSVSSFGRLFVKS